MRFLHRSSNAATGHKLVTVSALPLELVAKAEAGEPFDVIVLSIDVEGLIKKGKVEAASRSVLGQIGVGVAVRAGSPKPDFSTVEKFKQSLLNAKSIATSGEGSSGRFVAGLIERLGIADQVKPKIKSGGPGRSAQLVAAGEVDFVVSGLPPLIDTPNIEWLGLLPPEINSFVLFTAGLSTAAKEPEAGRALLRFLTTPEAMAVYKTKGLDPPDRSPRPAPCALRCHGPVTTGRLIDAGRDGGGSIMTRQLFSILAGLAMAGFAGAAAGADVTTRIYTSDDTLLRIGPYSFAGRQDAQSQRRHRQRRVPPSERSAQRDLDARRPRPEHRLQRYEGTGRHRADLQRGQERPGLSDAILHAVDVPRAAAR